MSPSAPESSRAVETFTLGVCIPTRHRPALLRSCLEHIARSSQPPRAVVVSDDSTDAAMLAENAAIVERYADTTYVRGPQRGVCANRNHALDRLGTVDYVAFLDDDALVDVDYFETALRHYASLSPDRRRRVIVSGVRREPDGGRTYPCRLDFRGYFEDCEPTEVAGASYAVFPRQFFDSHRWDEHIFFGYEDAELSLRALRDGFEIDHLEQLVLSDAGKMNSTLAAGDGERMSQYMFLGHAARLYIGVKRFGIIDRDLPKLGAFLVRFWVELIGALAKRRSLRRVPELVRVSQVAVLVPAVLRPSSRGLVDRGPP